MDVWPRFEHAVRRRHGVADLALAHTHGVARDRYFRRTAAEGWRSLANGVRLHPDEPRSVQQSVLSAASLTGLVAAASRRTALWLHDLDRRPPPRPSVVVAHATRCPEVPGVHIHRARWLTPADVTVTRGGVPTLNPPALMITLAAVDPPERLRAALIDLVHHGLTTPSGVAARLETVGPVPGRGPLAALCEEFADLVVESAFQDDVARTLRELGYPAERSVHRVEAADGITLHGDVALPVWKVVVETEGDAFHRTREQRRTDRRRAASWATTDHRVVPLDWRDWHGDRRAWLERLDAVIERQRRHGFGADLPSPSRG